MTSPGTQPPALDPLTRTQVLVAMGVTGMVLLGIAKLWQALATVSTLSVQWGQTSLLIGVGVALGITAASAGVYHLWPDYRRCADEYLQMALQPLLWPDLIWLGLLPGLSEELLFRGVMLPALGLNGVALLISSLLFGVMHLSNLRHWPYVLWATLMGTVLGVSAIATHNLLVPVVAHILTNWISSVVWKWQHRNLKTSV